MPEDDSLVIGRVARPHGIRGHVVVRPETDFPDQRYRAGEVLLIGDKPVPHRILSARFHQGRPILALEGVESIDDAEQLAGAEIRMPVAALGALPDGTFYHHDLIGCEVRDRSDVLLGRVAGVEGPMERSRLVVHSERGEFQVPLTAPICVSVEPSAGRIVVDPPEGLIELVLTPVKPRAETDGRSAPSTK